MVSSDEVDTVNVDKDSNVDVGAILEEGQDGRNILKLTMPDPTNVFGSILQYMYEGSIVIDENNAVPILSIAEYLKIEDLHKRVQEYLTSSLTRSTVLQVLKRALEIKTSYNMIGRCILIIARNFSQMYITGSNFEFLPREILLSILRHESLAVNSEYAVYKTIYNYLRSHYKSEEDIPYDVRNELFETVRFPFMKYDELEECIKDALVPMNLVAEALMIRLATHECPEKSQSSILRLQKRVTYGRLFEYSYDFDEKGVLYWIGTKGATAKWRNPSLVENGVKVTASSVEKGDPIQLVGRKQTESWTMDVPSSWYCVDLGPTRNLILTYYTLRHGGTSKQDSLRNWVLQASDDSKQWVVLCRHREEDVLGSKVSTYSWPVSTCTKPYRYFRILQTGHNVSNNNFLSLSGIEFYGELYESS